MPGMRRDAVTWDTDAAGQAITQAAVRGLAQGAEHIKAAAVPLTPLRDGPLRASAGTDVDAQSGQASISYDTPYAVEQHENLNYRHRDGQAKYLETALDIAGDDAIAIVAASIRRALQ